MKCIIPCAGESSRMNLVPKSHLLIDGKPLILHIVNAWRNCIDNFIFVLKKSATYFWELVPNGSAIVFQNEPSGLSDAILQAEGYVRGRFLVNLGDCVFSGTFDAAKIGTDLGIGVWITDDEYEFYKSYAVEVTDSYISRVQEKPKEASPKPLLCGMGIYFLDTRVFDYIRKTKAVPGGGDFTEVLQAMIDGGEKIRPVYFHGKYVNVGSPEDLKKAEEMLK